MNKDSRRRKRHTPPGPAGILFQTQQAASGKKSRKKSKKQQQHHHDDDPRDDKNPLGSSQVDDEEGLYDSFNNDVEKQLQDHRRRKRHGGFMTMSPSWASMQQDLGLATPYIDQLLESYHNGCTSFNHRSNGGDGGCDDDDDDDDVDGDPHFDSKRRYNLLRPYMPNRFLLLFEIVRGQYDLGFGGEINKINTTGDDANGEYGTSDNLDDDYIYRSDETALVVLVQSVQSSIHNNIWTVELTDETGSAIRAWIEPSFIQQQLQISAGLGQMNASSEPESNKESKSKTARDGNKSICDTTATEAESMVPETSTQPNAATNQQKNDNSPRKETQRRQTKPTNQYVIRPGVVWLLRKVSIMPAIVSDRGLLTVAGNGRVERMLLISGKSIAKAWVPEDATIDEKKDNEEEQTKYSNWIQKRCDITSRIEDGMDRVQKFNDLTNLNRREQHQDGSDEEDEHIEDDIEIQIDCTHIDIRDGLIHKKNHIIQSRVLNHDLDTEMNAVAIDEQISTNMDRRMFNAVSTPAPHNHNSNPYTAAGNIVTGSQHKRDFYNSGGNATNNTSLASSIATTNDEDRTKEGPPVASISSCNGNNLALTTPAGSRSALSISQSLARFRHAPDQPETQSQAHSQFAAIQQGNSQLSVMSRSQDHFYSQQMETQPCPASNSITSQDLSSPKVEIATQTSAAATTTYATTKLRAENFRSSQPPSTQPEDDGRTQGKTINGVHSPMPKVQSKEQTLVNSTNKEQRKSSEKKRKKKEQRNISLSPKTPIRKQHPIGSKSIWEAAVDDESIDALFDDNDGINDKAENFVPRKEGKEDKSENVQSDQDRAVQKPKGRDSIHGRADIAEENELLTVPEKQPTKKSIFDIPLDDQDVNLDDFDL